MPFIKKIIMKTETINNIYNINNTNNIPIDIRLEKGEMPVKQMAESMTIYLSHKYDSNFECLKELALNGIKCGLFLDSNKKVVWSKWIDLFNFFKLNFNNIRALEPFTSLVSFKIQKREGNINSIYCNDSFHYIHINKSGNIALSDENLKCNIFISDIHLLEERKEEISNLIINGYYSHFLRNDKCSFCPGWPLCNASFYKDKSKYCSLFFKAIFEFKNYLCSIKNEKN
jgi:hypothetical protein